MIASELKIGDRVRITGVSPVFVGFLPNETRRVWQKLAKRGRSVRISEIDEYGAPWYHCRFKRKNGSWEHHFLNVGDVDANWVVVKKR